MWFDQFCMGFGKIIIIAGGIRLGGEIIFLILNGFYKKMQVGAAFFEFLLKTRGNRR